MMIYHLIYHMIYLIYWVIPPISLRGDFHCTWYKGYTYMKSPNPEGVRIPEKASNIYLIGMFEGLRACPHYSRLVATGHMAWAKSHRVFR